MRHAARTRAAVREPGGAGGRERRDGDRRADPPVGRHVEACGRAYAAARAFPRARAALHVASRRGMILSWPVVGAVLFGALLHASWNALVKSSQDKALDTAVIHVMGSFVALPIVLVVGWPPAAAWPYIATSVVIHIAYYIALTGAYQH